MKKIFVSFISLLALLLVPASGNAQSETTRVWIDDDLELVADGKTINWLTLYENDPNVDYVAFNVEIMLPKGLTIAQGKNDRGKLVDQFFATDRFDESHSLSKSLNILSDNEYFNVLKIACTSGENEQLYNTDITGNPLDALVRVGLIADPSIEIGEVEIRLKDACFVYEDAHYATYLNGEFFTTKANVVKPMTIDYTLTDARIGTLILPFDCAVPAGLTVSTCSAVNADNYVVQVPSETIKANTPYLVEGTSGDYSFTGNVGVIDESETFQEGVLVGVLQETQPNVGDYVLQNIDGHVAFYLYGEENQLKVGANRCYLTLANASEVKVVNVGLMTGIDCALANGNRVDVYTLSGELVRSRVSAGDALSGLKAGVYIVNGVKTIKTAN